MTNRKLGLAALLAAAVTFGVAACGPKPAEEAAPPAETTEPAPPAPEMSAAPPVDSTMPSAMPSAAASTTP
ncbi:MAG: hypothetical protein AB7M12_13890 [Hyphomonadaceae bacterium]